MIYHNSYSISIRYHIHNNQKNRITRIKIAYYQFSQRRLLFECLNRNCYQISTNIHSGHSRIEFKWFSRQNLICIMTQNKFSEIKLMHIQSCDNQIFRNCIPQSNSYNDQIYSIILEYKWLINKEKLNLRDYEIEFVPGFVKIEKNCTIPDFPDHPYKNVNIALYYLIFSTPLDRIPPRNAALIPSWCEYGMEWSKKPLNPSKNAAKNTLDHTQNKLKPPVLYENSRMTRTILMNGSMSWMEIMNLHSVPGLLLTLKSRFTLLTLVEMTESSLCFNHKDNTQVCNCTNYLNENFINQKLNEWYNEDVLLKRAING